MKYYYSNKGKAEGPLEEGEIDQLAEQGVIRKTTPVIAEGSNTWSTYGALWPDKAAAQEGKAGASGEQSSRPFAGKGSSGGVLQLLGRLIHVNLWVDRLLNRLLRLPRWVPEGREDRLSALNALSGITCLIVWASIVVSTIFVSLNAPIAMMVPIVLGGIVYGFILQYLIYQLNRNTNTLLLGQRVVMSSNGMPRFIAMVSLLLFFMILLTSLISLWTSPGGAVLQFAIALILLGVVYVCTNAEKTIVRICPDEVSPGREFNNYMKFSFRAVTLSAQVLSPVLVVLGMLSLIFTALASDGLNSLVEVLVNVYAALVLIHLPFLTWLLLGLTSWIFDLLDAIFSHSKA